MLCLHVVDSDFRSGTLGSGGDEGVDSEEEIEEEDCSRRCLLVWVEQEVRVRG